MGEKHLPRRQECWHLVSHTNLTKPKITQYFFFYSNPSGLVHNHLCTSALGELDV